MKVSVYYEEVSNYVEKHYLVRPSIKQVMIRPCPSNTLHISSFLQLVLQYELKQCARMLYVCRMNVARLYLY